MKIGGEGLAGDQWWRSCMGEGRSRSERGGGAGETSSVRPAERGTEEDGSAQTRDRRLSAELLALVARSARSASRGGAIVVSRRRVRACRAGAGGRSRRRSAALAREAEDVERFLGCPLAGAAPAEPGRRPLPRWRPRRRMPHQRQRGRPATGWLHWQRNARTGAHQWFAQLTLADGSRPIVELNPRIPESDREAAKACASR